MNKEQILDRIAEIETAMNGTDFWVDKNKAQALVRELQDLKAEAESGGPHAKYDRGDAIMTIFSGAGGDDAEDFSAMLYRMYQRYAGSHGLDWKVIHENENDLYVILKNESGVHRLVRISPFNADAKRHTSFSMVEVIPKFESTNSADIKIEEKDLDISIAKSSGPGGQNVNKRETAVRIVHKPSGISVHVTSERSQAQNKEKALDIIRAKLYKQMEDERIAKEKGMYVSKTTSIDWGNQIRSYVLHPYKMVKDHRTNVETAQVNKVLEGDLEMFLEAERGL
jgi:peptide chain release factor 2